MSILHIRHIFCPLKIPEVDFMEKSLFYGKGLFYGCKIWNNICSCYNLVKVYFMEKSLFYGIKYGCFILVYLVHKITLI